MEETSRNHRVVVVDGSDAGPIFADCLVKKGIGFVHLKSPSEIAPDIGPLFLYPNGAQVLDQLGIPKTLMIETKSLQKVCFQSDFGNPIAVDDIFGELRERYTRRLSTLTINQS